MLDYIENLKTKPDHVKKRFAFLVSFSFTFLVFVGWIASYGFTSNSSTVAVADAPVSSLTATALGAWDDIKSMILGSNKVEYSQDVIEISGGGR